MATALCPSVCFNCSSLQGLSSVPPFAGLLSAHPRHFYFCSFPHCLTSIFSYRTPQLMDHLQNVSYFKFLRVNLMGGPCIRRLLLGLPLVVQWLRLYTPNAGGIGLILGRGTKVPECHTACLPRENAQTKKIQIPHSSWKPHLTELEQSAPECFSRTRHGLSSLPPSPSLSSILCLGCFAHVTPAGPKGIWVVPKDTAIS